MPVTTRCCRRRRICISITGRAREICPLGQRKAVARDGLQVQYHAGEDPAEQRKHILGVQGNLWAEMMRSEDRVTYMAYPRAAALAEVNWSAPERINWDDFQQRLEAQLPRYDGLGIRYAREVAIKPAARRRVSHDLDRCGGGYVLSLEDDAPIEGERAVFLVNITDPCWIWKDAQLTDIGAIRVTVGQIPFHFQIGKDAGYSRHKPATRDGELEIRLGSCDVRRWMPCR